jgi:hypothetical protein
MTITKTVITKTVITKTGITRIRFRTSRRGTAAPDGNIQ